MANTQYTEKQLKIINGEIPLETVDGHSIHWLYKKAIANNDLTLAEKAYNRSEQLKEEARKRNCLRVVKSRALRRKGIYQWKEPKSSDYTEYQRRVIRGQIPFDKVLSKDLIKIYQKALLKGDIVLAETVFELIRYRREESLQKDRKRKGNGKRYNLIEGFEDFDLDSPLSKWNQAVLKGVISLNDCEENDIIKIIDILEEAGDKKELKIAKQLLSYKKDISLLYVTTNHWKAIDMIEKLLQLPIQRPASLLVDE